VSAPELREELRLKRRVAALTRTVRGLVFELELTPEDDGMPTRCVANLDNLHTLRKDAFRRRVVQLPSARMSQACITGLAACSVRGEQAPRRVVRLRRC
jgi:mRNA-degrading endonuclease toxin of MazEF toxin-antitoxin module